MAYKIALSIISFLFASCAAYGVLFAPMPLTIIFGAMFIVFSVILYAVWFDSLFADIFD